MDSTPVPPPVVCTLSPTRLAAQKLEWADLASLASSRREIDGGVATTYPLELAEQIEDLANREIHCCGSWLDIAHERRERDFHLRLTTTNPEGIALIRTLSGSPSTQQ